MALVRVHSRSRPEEPLLVSSAPDGWPPGWAGPVEQVRLAAPVTGCQAAPVSGPDRTPSGDSRYPAVPVSSRDTAPPGPGPADAPGTGAQLSLPRRLE